MTIRMRTCCVILFGVLLSSGLLAQSGPKRGGSEMQLWTAGGHSVPGVRPINAIWNFGLRYGWVLTDAHGPGFLKGRLEYAVDAVPVYVIFQDANTAYGVGLNPLNLKWNLSSRDHWFPFLELSGGLLFSNHDVPSGTGRVNFTPSAALGVHILRKQYSWAVEARYLHISDAGLTRLNPGINTFEVRLGFGRFRGGK